MENVCCEGLDSSGLQYGPASELYNESNESIALGHNNWQLPPCFWTDLTNFVAVLQQWLHIRSECSEKTPCCHTAIRFSEHGCNPALPKKIVKTGKQMTLLSCTLQLLQETQTVFRCDKSCKSYWQDIKFKVPNKGFMQCREWLLL